MPSFVFDKEADATGGLPLDVWNIIFRRIQRRDWISVICLNKTLSPIAKKLFIKKEVQSIEGNQRAFVDFVENAIPKNDFAVALEVPIWPHIEAAGIPVTFPVLEQNCKDMIQKSEMTPFGKGMQTLVDTNIRSGWQIDASQITIHSQNWLRMFSNSADSSLLEKIRQSLAPNTSNISASLYKLLVYEKGDKFKPHKDTIRGKNHFGSLVVFFPSAYTGGDFVIRHNGETLTFNYSINNPSVKETSIKIHCVAFFTDCEHEVFQVESGYRVGLTYNLYYAGNHVKPQVTTFYPKEIYQAHFQSFWDSLTKVKGIGFLFDHCYSEETLKAEQLKGRDHRLYHLVQSLDLGWNIQLASVTVTLHDITSGIAKCSVDHDNFDCEDFTVANVMVKDILADQRQECTVSIKTKQPIHVKFSGTFAKFRKNRGGELEEWNGNFVFAIQWSQHRAENVTRRFEGISGNEGSETHSLLYTAAALLLIPPANDVNKRKSEDEEDEEEAEDW